MGHDERTPVEDVDDMIHREEDDGAPPNMPPDSEEDFEKAIRGEHEPGRLRVPPSSAD
jgi:hypothetical protein